MGKSKFVIAFLVSFLCGVFLGDIFKIGTAYLIFLIAGAILVLILAWEKILWRLAIFALLSLILGVFYLQYWSNDQAVNIKDVTSRCQIIGYPEIEANKATYIVRCEKLILELSTGRYPTYEYGDLLEVSGTIKKPSLYLIHQNISGQLNPSKIKKIGNNGNLLLKIIYKTKDKFEITLNRIFKEPYASFAAGLILGSKQNIPDSLVSDFNRTGTTHIIAVSGFNVTILVVWIGLLLGLISRRLKFIGTIIIVILFVVLTGASASVVRAGILACLIIFGKNMGRRINMAILVLLVATLMVLTNPYLLKYDVSFQLSFLAFLGLVYLSPKILAIKLFKQVPNILRQTLAETSAAQLMVLPLLIYYFGQASLISPLVNVLILWIIPLAMLVVFLSAISGIAIASFGHLVGLVAVWPLRFIVYVVQSLSKVSWASISIQTKEWWWIIVYFAVLAILFIKVKENEQEKITY